MSGARTGIVVAGVVALAVSAQAFAEKTTEEFANGTARPRSIAFLPVKATVTRARMVETEGLVDDSVKFGGEFNARIQAALTAKGYQVVVIDTDRLNTDPKLQEYVVETQRGFDDMMSKYKPKNMSKHMYKVGDSGRVLADYLHVDGLAFSTMSITITPMGKAIFSGLVGGTTSGANANLEIVDGKTGELEAWFLGIAIVAPGDKTNADLSNYVATLAERSTNRVPGADPSARIDVAQSDEAVLEEAESALKR
jgi:hypothetical protein